MLILQTGTLPPSQILVQILSSIREASDLSACLSTCKSLQVLAIDPVLGATWLLNRHRDQPRLTLLKAAQQGNGAVMSQLLKMGVSATECSPLQLAISHDLYEVGAANHDFDCGQGCSHGSTE